MRFVARKKLILSDHKKSNALFNRTALYGENDVTTQKSRNLKSSSWGVP